MIFSGGSLKFADGSLSDVIIFGVPRIRKPFCNHRSHNFWSPLKLLSHTYDVKKHIFPVIDTLDTLCVKSIDVMKTVISSQTLVKTIELHSKLDCRGVVLYRPGRAQALPMFIWALPILLWALPMFCFNICMIRINNQKNSNEASDVRNG